ncbi:Per1p Ecym_1077 [Eremothecium cymbalariae DBVPG|uniref:Post-GPI attachment to proteins factor 3 n=1 Tax=Eremothecium cymbalariae (strain CBS 270.75 / DBVPG 7215 / KCTC 17166 / NRRL Y-17582) TaxID=931890 RepID=G8JMC6_ERECY|nr:hypothetical protein Ecym_1077 [Eremothecium cymbalariae DBVPG\
MRREIAVLWGYLCLNVLASPGDTLDEFERCNEACLVNRNCADEGQINIEGNSFTSHVFSDIPWVYKQIFWDCSSDCDYQCQQIVTRQRIRDGEEIYQFHGKWPFIRSAGMQEFFSTLFSIGNFIPHWNGFCLLKMELAKVPAGDNSRVILEQYVNVAIIGMLAWTFSSIYHTRDLFITEKMDYFFAGATVLTAFHAIFVRVNRLDRLPVLRRLVSVFVLLIFSLHILRLYFDWSYTYNMRFNILFGVLEYLMLIVLAIKNRKSLKRKKNYRNSLYKPYSNSNFHLFWMPVLLVLFTSLAMTSELFDFFSYDLQMDSHAIWHALTIVPSYFLYKFFIIDYNYLSSIKGTISQD